MFDQKDGICIIHNERFIKYSDESYACESCCQEAWDQYLCAEWEEWEKHVNNLYEEPLPFKEK